MHSTGVDHEYVKENIRFLNSMVHELSQKLENTLIIIIADQWACRLKSRVFK